MAINKFMIRLLLPIIFISKSVVSISNFSLAKLDCRDHCGNIPIPYPFGLTEKCSLNDYFLVTCNETSRSHHPKAYLMNSMHISDISLDGQIRVLQDISHDCYAPNGASVSGNNPSITLPDHYTVNNTANKVTIVGCDTYGFFYGTIGNHNYTTGCAATCNTKDDLLEGSCSGLGCCQTAIPQEISSAQVELHSFHNYTNVNDFNNCGYGFVVEESVFSPANLTNFRDVKKLPMVVDWGIDDKSCWEAQKNRSSYACNSSNSECSDPRNGSGYRCFCKKGYEGNPYLPHGCQDIDECKDPSLNNCEKHCENNEGGYRCSCPKGYLGDGTKGSGGCYRDKSLELKLVAGSALGIIALILAACWTYFELRRRKLIEMKQTFFLQNGGLLLQEKLRKRDRSLLEMVKIFTSSELKKATNNFHENMIIGKGGYGTVYKGILQNNKVVAIKKSKEVYPSQIEQFINELIILSQVRHRNIVRLLGCCLETQVPLLVYEFIGNGTLYENLQNKDKSQFLSWENRLKIAAETADVLSYLHSAASNPIIHRDIKSANILLDALFTAKVSDFGASRLVPLDRAQLSTMVQGTLGYLDPEYMQTSQLTEKSDVYSFGVVLLELLTGRKALNYDKPEEEINLANFFLYILRKDRLFEILEENIVCDETREQIIEVSKLAKKCLNVRGDDRPTMKEMAMALDALRLGGRNSWAKVEDDQEEIESLFGKGLSSISFSDDHSESITVPR